MNDINAVLALGNLRRISEILKKRSLIQTIYNLEFKNLPVRIPAYSKTVQYYTLRVSDRDFISERLAENDIATSVHFKPLSEMTYWKKAVKNPLPVTDRVWKELLSLPCHDALSAEEQKHIVKTFKNALLASSNNPAGW
jgi:dTDP-4-amino-4,6-dideoxygalactose transaminase